MDANQVKKIYRSYLLKLHPDKINQQHGRAPTEAEANDLLKLNQQYQQYKQFYETSEETAPPKPPPTPPPTYPGQGWTRTSSTKTKKQRCCSHCKQPGHNKITCPELYPRKAARRERKQQNAQEKPKQTPQQKTEEKTQNTTFAVEFEKVKQTINLHFAVPTGVKAGDVIQIPYLNRKGDSCVHDFKIKDFQVGRPFLNVSIAF